MATFGFDWKSCSPLPHAASFSPVAQGNTVILTENDSKYDSKNSLQIPKQWQPMTISEQ
jgi:hypothetical protein